MKVKIKVENNIITGYLYIKQLTPKLIKTGCNFDETTDLKNAIEIEIADLSLLKVGEQKLIKNRLIDLTDAEKEEYRKSLENNQ